MAAVAVGAGGEGAGSGDAAQSVDGAGPAQALGRDPAGAAAPVGAAFEPGGAGGDLPRPGRRGVFAEDRRGVGSGAVDSVEGSRRQRRPPQLSGAGRRSGGMGSGVSAEADEAGPVAGVAGDGRGQAGVALVAGADRRVAAAAVPDRNSDARVARDHLPLAVRAGPRRPAARTDPAPAHRPGDAPAEGNPAARRAGRPAEHLEHLPAAGRGRRSGGARALGRATWSSAAG